MDGTALKNASDESLVALAKLNLRIINEMDELAIEDIKAEMLHEVRENTRFVLYGHLV
jgi:hypothetical protein